MSRPVSCAAGGWCVSHTTGANVPGGGARLSVFRLSGRDALSYRRGDHDGRWFPSSEAAAAFTLERGYCAPHLRQDVGTFKLVHRVALRRIMLRARVRLDLAMVPAEVVDVADAVKREVLALGCGVLMPLAWSNGVYTMARRLRPGLFASQS